MRNVSPRKLILSMIPRKCEKCSFIQHVFFVSSKEFDSWECPACKKEKENIDNEVDVVYDDLENKEK